MLRCNLLPILFQVFSQKTTWAITSHQQKVSFFLSSNTWNEWNQSGFGSPSAFFFLQITPWECHFSFAFPNKPADVFRFLYHPAAVRLQRRPLQGWPGHGLENDGKSQLTRPKNDDIYHGDSSWGCPKMVGFPPKSSHFDRVFQYKPSILGYPYIFSTKWGFPNMVGFPYPNHGVFLLKIDDHFGLWNGGTTIWGNPHMGWIDGMKFENGDASFFLVFQKTR